MTDKSVARRASIVKAALPRRLRNVKQVPFVELYAGRLQGVVSSGSDPNRVYVSCFEAGTMNYSCSTNNNRPCGGGGHCSHLRELMQQAVETYGADRVAKYLQIPGEFAPEAAPYELLNKVHGSPTRPQVSAVFSRFLSYLRYVELGTCADPNPELTWFVAG